MANMATALYDIRLLDEMGIADTPIHRRHPVAKLLVTFVYLILVISFNKFEISGLLPMILFPVFMSSMGGLPLKPLFKRILIVMPLILGIGIFNPFLDQRPALFIGQVSLSYGWLSFISLVIKCVLTVFTSLILIATTGMTNIALALRTLKVPKIFVLQLLLTYRYISVFMEEIIVTTNAYALRAPFVKGIHFQHWGSLMGQLLLRTMDRAQRVYTAMCCKGFEGEYHTGAIPQMRLNDVVFTIGWIAFFILVRYINIPQQLGTLLTGVIT